VVFQWTNNTPAIGLAAAGTGNIPSFIAQNPGTTPLVATITVTPVTGLSTPVTTTFAFTGAVQTYTVPAGITSLNIKTWGAQGNTNSIGAVVGGLGGYAEGNLAVVPGQVLNINVGGGAATSINGGFNGGGAAGVNAGCATAQGGGGGGASDVRIAPYALANRVIVGAGGGGAGANRVAGCGRGTGGGGGGGYYGGGGGAGWPGIPGSEGPVPTGGTQAAGGAGGITTFSPGPTNGFPGALGVGGAGGTEIGSNQGGSATAEPGGIGGGLTGGSGLYNNVNNWCGQSGAGGSSYIGGVSGGLTTPGLRSGNGQVQITYTPASATTCFGTARTFTITVNPNANLIIVADPGTTICEGDPTLLTVYDAGSVTAPGTLYTQGTAPVNGSPSQVFEPVNAPFDSQSADDFTVPAGGNWGITQITANGIGTGAPTSVNVFFYTNAANLPGTTIASFTNITTFTRVGGNYTVTLPSAVNLTAGTYWMSFQVNMSFAAGGQWFWGNFGAANVGNEYAWRNPGGGFATPCTNWGYGGTGCNVGGGPANRNNIFSIIGTNVGLGPQSTGTFLWSPALGLSSTTTNPVAASPMNTTTYTVTRTTVPGGCQASAQVTITVNKRPVVTSHPVSRVNCVGTTATFTVGGTGTGLAYQWQVNTGGCAGATWTNVPNLAPYSGVNGPVLSIIPVNQLMNGYAYRCVLSGTCTPFIPPTNVSNCATLTVNPLPNIAVTPPVSCGGIAGISGTALTVTAFPPPVPGSVTVNSGVIAVPIPDGSNVAATSNLTVAGIPAAATITDVKINMNINHTWVGDVDVNIKAPNAAILNLVAGLDNGAGGNQTDNFTNTAFSSLGGSTISGFAAPRTGTFTAEARAGRGPIGFLQTVTTWGALYPTAAAANGVWTLAMGDRVATDAGTLTNWSITINYNAPGTGPIPTLNYVWTPNTTVAAGLYTNNTATNLYTGTNLTTVYAAPPAQTTYTVTATDAATGCVNTATALVNYTPPAPTVTPNPVVMCLGDPAVKLKSSSSTPFVASATSGTISLAVPDNTANGVNSTLSIAGIPANATITNISVALNMPHTYPADMIFNLKAPNGQILNLYKHNTNTDNGPASVPTAGFFNAVVNATSSTSFVSVPNPFRYGQTAPAGPYKADALNGVTNPGYTIMDPTGFVSNAANFAALYGTPNGTYTLAMADGGPGDLGTLTSWSITVNYVIGVPASPAVWSPSGPGSGLFNDANATSVYTGNPIDSVWAKPTPAGVYTYTVTVNNLITTLATPTTPMAGGNGNNLVSFNVRNNNPYPVTFSSISSNTFGSGAVTSTVYYKTTGNAGNPGPISAANGFNPFGSAASTVTAGSMNLLISGMTLQIPAGATYAIALDMTGATFPAYTNGTGTVITYSNGGCDIMVDGNVGWGGPNAPGTPANNPRNFNGSITFLGSGPGTCQSPPRTVTVTVNNPTTVTTQPVNQTVCTDKVATFTVVPGGSGPFSYQWQVSTNNGNPPWNNVINGGVYSGATTATLTITAPPVSMSGYQYRVIITGAAPCASATSLSAILTVNPLPVVTISPVYSAIMPGMTVTLTSTVTPNAASTYSWIRDGVVLTSTSAGVLSGIGTGTLKVDVDGMGLYTLRVTDVNGCTNTSNSAIVQDSASGKCFIYPNPNSGTFQVRYYSVANNNNLPRGIVVYDAKGDRVFLQNYTIGRPYDRMDVDMRAYGKGLYWVEIVDRDGNRLTICRVVIQ
jgi:subtilisin-like proprotein convertase family protein